MHNSPFYPSYCNRLLRHVYNITTGHHDDPQQQHPHHHTTSVKPISTIGWGWGPWGEW